MLLQATPRQHLLAQTLRDPIRSQSKKNKSGKKQLKSKDPRMMPRTIEEIEVKLRVIANIEIEGAEMLTTVEKRREKLVM